MAGPRALWLALVSLYEETLPLLVGNLGWVAFNAPLYALLVAIFLPFAGETPQLMMITIAWLLPFMPSPGALGLAAVAATAAGPDIPRLTEFWAALRARWRISLVCFGVSIAVALALLVNTYLYIQLTQGWLRFGAVLFLYGMLFWLSLHLYLMPLMVHVSEAGVLDLYRRAALISLGHPAFTLLLLVSMIVISSLSLIFVPIYLLVGAAYLAMIQAHAFREIRRRHGDLPPAEVDEGMRRL